MLVLMALLLSHYSGVLLRGTAEDETRISARELTEYLFIAG